MRINKKAIADSGAQTVFVAAGAMISHNNGQKVAFDNMLKKYGSGWLTRIVRAQRNWCFQTPCQSIGESQHSTTTGQIAIFPPLFEIRFPI